MNCMIGLDIGTSAVKAALLTADGRILGTASEGFSYFGEDGARLIAAEDYCAACFSVIRRLADLAGEEHKVTAVCSCGASGNLLLLDREDRPLTPVIGWQSAAPEEDCNTFFSEEEKADFHRLVGWPFSSHFSAAWLCSINLHHKELLDKAHTVAMSIEYMNFLLTGKWGVSHSMGTPFFLIDQEKGQYSRLLLEKLGIADKQLPPIYDKGTVLGTVTADMAQQLHLSSDTVVVLGSFDHPSGALGAGILHEGEMLLSCGTSWVELFPVCDREFALSTGGLVDRFMLNGAPYCVMKSVTSLSVLIDQLRRMYFGDISLRDFDALVDQGESGCGGLVFTFTESDTTAGQGFAPQQIARAIIEAAANKLKENLSELRQCGLHADRIVAIGGITNSRECMDVLEQVLGMPISVVNGQSAGAVGSCLLAGIATGVFGGEEAAFDMMYSAQTGNAGVSVKV